VSDDNPGPIDADELRLAADVIEGQVEGTVTISGVTLWPQPSGMCDVFLENTLIDIIDASQFWRATSLVDYCREVDGAAEAETAVELDGRGVQ